MIPTAQKFVDMLKELPREEKSKSPKSKLVKFAVIVNIDDPENKPQIRFEGETITSGKRYPCMDDYIPVIGDSVMVFHGIVMGKIRGKKI